MLGKIEGRKKRGKQRMSWLDSITDSMDMNLSKLPEIVKNREAWHVAVHGVTKVETTICTEFTNGATWLSQENGKVSESHRGNPAIKNMKL